MRIAVCFSGLIRTGLNCSDNIKRFLGDMLPYCDFFLHTWDYETVKPFFRSHWNGIPFVQRQDEILCNNKLQKFINTYNIKNYKVDSYSDFIENVVNNNNILPTVWHTMSRSFDLKKQYEQCNDFKYDVVIKIRPDVIFPAKKTFAEELRSIDTSKSVIYSDPHCDVRLDDVFWITNSDVANVVIELPYDEMCQKSVFDNFIIIDFLKKNGIIHKPLSKSGLSCYTIYRYESYMFDPMYNFRECFNNDIIHYSSKTEEEIKQVISNNYTLQPWSDEFKRRVWRV
jgi:hypothetical protein